MHAPFNSYTTLWWLFQPFFSDCHCFACARFRHWFARDKPAVYRIVTHWLGAPLFTALRWLAPFHIVHAYGVFAVKEPPEAAKGWRVVLSVEGAGADKQFEPYEYRYLCGASLQRAAPVAVAPHQPRLDHNMFYMGIQQRACLFNALMPYNQVSERDSFMHRILLLLLKGDEHVTALFRKHPTFSASNPPAFVRVVKHAFRYATPSELRINPHNFWVQRSGGPGDGELVVLPTQFSLPRFRQLFAALPATALLTNHFWRDRLLAATHPAVVRSRENYKPARAATNALARASSSSSGSSSRSRSDDDKDV
jgi:hypothetical protein